MNGPDGKLQATRNLSAVFFFSHSHFIDVTLFNKIISFPSSFFQFVFSTSFFSFVSNQTGSLGSCLIHPFSAKCTPNNNNNYIWECGLCATICPSRRYTPLVPSTNSLSLFFSLLFRRSYFANSNLTIIRPQRLAVASARVCLFARNILRVSILDYIIMYKHRLMEHNLAANNLVRAYSFIECQFIGAEKKEEREKKKTRQTTTTAARCR